MKHRKKIGYSVAFIIALIINLYFFSAIYNVEITGNVILAAMGMSLILPLLVWSQSKKKIHFGNFMGIAGLTLLIEAGIPMIGNLYLPILDKEVWWIIKEQQTLFLLGGVTIFGVILFLINIRAMIMNWIFIRPFGGRKLG